MHINHSAKMPLDTPCALKTNICMYTVCVLHIFVRGGQAKAAYVQTHITYTVSIQNALEQSKSQRYEHLLLFAQEITRTRNNNHNKKIIILAQSKGKKR